MKWIKLEMEKALQQEELWRIKKEKPAAETKVGPKTGKKLSYKDQRELETLPQTIESLEQQLEAAHQALADPSLYQESAEKIAELKQQSEEIEQTLETAFARWETLEALKNNL